MELVFYKIKRRIHGKMSCVFKARIAYSLLSKCKSIDGNLGAIGVF